MGIYGAGCIFFVYTSALVPWIISVNNFRFSNTISETVLPRDMYNISLERSFYSASDRVSCIKIHPEIKALLQVKVLSFYIHWCLWFLTAYSHSLIKYSYYFTHKSYKMVDNKSKTPLIRHIQKKYITHEDKQYNTRAAHSYNIVIFIRDIFFLYMSFGKFSYYHMPMHMSNVRL